MSLGCGCGCDSRLRSRENTDYYTYSILLLCWLIAPLNFYVILTQSKTLRGFKWLILNHFIWCLAVQTLFAIVKPVLLFPAIAGFPLGYPKDGDFKSTATAYFFATMFIINKGIALTATLFCRYLLAFPSMITKWFTFKRGAIFMTGFTIVNYSTLTYFKIIPFFKMDREMILQIALKQNPSLAQFFNETGFLALELNSAKTGFFISLAAFMVALLFAMFTMVFFTYHVKSHKTLIISKLQRSLIISAIAEIAMAITFIVIPLMIFLSIICFQIPNTGNWSIYIFSFLLTHSVLQSIITLFFITPYRKCISVFLTNLFSHKKYDSAPNIAISLY